jgi:hypothetical protein
VRESVREFIRNSDALLRSKHLGLPVR